MAAANLEIRTVRDLIGDPSSWQNHINDGDNNVMPDMGGATILDVFCTGNQLSVYSRNFTGIETLAIFFVDDSGLCARMADALQPGLEIHKALGMAVA